MRSNRAITMAAVALGLCGPARDSAHAGVVYSDGGTHIVTGANPDVTVSNGTTLNVQPGANITGAPGNMGAGGMVAAAPGITASTPGTAVDISGGTITGGDDKFYGGAEGILVEAGASLTMSAGTVSGGDSLYGHATAVYGGYPGPITISGGTIIGGSSGYGLEIVAIISNLTISGGNINNGFILASNPVGGNITISGGNLIGSNTFSSQILTDLDSKATITGGTFSGPIPLLLNYAGTFTITGGTFNEGLMFQLFDTGNATVLGGTFNDGIAFNLSDGGTLTFLGSNLSYSAGRISGTLADGQAISTTVTNQGYPYHLAVSTPSEIMFVGNQLPVTPEPASVIMLSLGLAGVAPLAWMRRAA